MSPQCTYNCTKYVDPRQALEGFPMSKNQLLWKILILSHLDKVQDGRVVMAATMELVQKQQRMVNSLANQIAPRLKWNPHFVQIRKN